jgi:hypothetical protein
MSPPGTARSHEAHATVADARDQGHKHHTEGQHALQAMLVGHVAKDGVPARAWCCWFANVACSSTPVACDTYILPYAARTGKYSSTYTCPCVSVLRTGRAAGEQISGWAHTIKRASGGRPLDHQPLARTGKEDMPWSRAMAPATSVLAPSTAPLHSSVGQAYIHKHHPITHAHGNALSPIVRRNAHADAHTHTRVLLQLTRIRQ